MKKNIFFIITLTFRCIISFGQDQDEKNIEVSFLPTLGFNISLPVVTPQSSKRTFSYTTGTKARKDYFAGIGLQVQFWDMWQSTLKIARTSYGSGWKFEYPLPSPELKEVGASSYSFDINVLDFTTEKKLFNVQTSTLFNSRIKVAFQGLVGIRFAWVPRLDRVDSVESISSITVIGLMKASDSIKRLRYGSGALSFGFNAQLYINNHRSVKVGALYSYAPNPLFEFRTNVEYYAGLGGNDQFKTLSSKHQLLLYFEYPIRFLKWKDKE